MRFVSFVGFGLFALVTPSLAADYPILRGSAEPLLSAPGYYRWSGIYFGAQGAFSSTSVDFSQATGPLLAYILRNTDIESNYNVSGWTTLSKRDTAGVNYGGFIGYNFQWDDAVLGVEINYLASSLKISSSDSMTRVGMVTSIGAEHDVTVLATAALNFTDLGTLRGRAGWAFGPFMPYVVAGLAVGRADVEKKATVQDNWCTPAPCAPATRAPYTETANKTGVFGYGYALGGGIDWAILPNVFLRGEYEFIDFRSFSDMRTYVSSFRGAVGLRF